ncbi:sodium-dependent nutrient amino acid transporter 1 [Zeugodacus cucurbitae]|uniref:sodium-dependent nutrient amino acid transporter 1 n=1 Tax=Zeugodacus cucurbitae TaxID=28588 RepID=UPI0023D9052C|nr:sodium-dependent nutrient amino acid transporter 1 [Zeugodacus cucurbitae]XP_054089761.1 sodium-dependent nutrient amino acid transporter 1 [Zeugodacus cucurbitae]XP_054089762.1 sodium-dependent nutrient amino acid transporter 1 [Zeugodacus cucurbitae]XP_054089763.1 sodium-dependent nutrient amino acid transporter 1 [Zeugodacus cucurbitae]
MANNDGYVNNAYVPTNSTNHSTTSIPGAYRTSVTFEPSRNDYNGRIVVPTTNNSITPASQKSEELPKLPTDTAVVEDDTKRRDTWANDIEFLMSCIALSVGLGNVWRFPFTALENGGGAFVIPYIIVLFLVGKPVYYMEMLLGQLSSRGSIKVFDFSPIMRGVGYGQVFATAIVSTYYATLMAITLRYLIESCYPTLPWSYCREEWGDACVNSKVNKSNIFTNESTVKTTSAEFYFTKVILREKDSIDDGIGYPSWTLALTLAVSWIVITSILIKGIKSSGKASYVLAIFPYVVLFILLIRSLTLPGAFNGVLYFLKPQWNKLLDPQVWYAAITQVFFSLAICFGNIIMYASYNRFRHNIKRDCTIVTTLDTFTSLLSGIIIFGILGNLAHESNTTDIQNVVKSNTGLAFISYPDAIAKFEFIPQVFSVLFFLMLFVLGIGSNVGMASCVMTVLKDKFNNTKNWIIAVSIAIVCYAIGLIYITPGGQYLLNFMDFFGASFIALVLAIFELIAVGWIYGVKNLCRDVYFMLGIKTSIYYRICWGIVTPAFMAAVLIYTLVNYTPLQYNGYTYQTGLYVFGWCISAFGIGQLLIWGVGAVWNCSDGTLCERIKKSFKPKANWGPLDPVTLKEYQLFKTEERTNEMFKKTGFCHKVYDNIFG